MSAKTDGGHCAVTGPSPVNTYPEIAKLVRQDLQDASLGPMQGFRLIRAKSGVYVYRCMCGDVPAVVKYFENEGDRREIQNYRILARHNIPTVKILALGEAHETFRFLLANCGRLRGLIFRPQFTLTYNDFYWTNLAIDRDMPAAKMLLL